MDDSLVVYKVMRMFTPLRGCRGSCAGTISIPLMQVMQDGAVSSAFEATMKGVLKLRARGLVQETIEDAGGIDRGSGTRDGSQIA